MIVLLGRLQVSVMLLTGPDAGVNMGWLAPPLLPLFATDDPEGRRRKSKAFYILYLVHLGF